MNKPLVLIVLIAGVVVAGAAFGPSIGLANDVPADQSVVATGTPQAEVSGSVAPHSHYVQGCFHVYYWYWNGSCWQKTLYGVYYSRYEADHAAGVLRYYGWNAWVEFRYY